MKDMLAKLQLQHGESFSRQRALDWFQEHYPKIKVGTITAHLGFLSTNSRSRIHHSIKPGEDDLFYGNYILNSPRRSVGREQAERDAKESSR